MKINDRMHHIGSSRIFKQPSKVNKKHEEEEEALKRAQTQ
jgi:hypothetical protein